MVYKMYIISTTLNSKKVEIIKCVPAWVGYELCGYVLVP